MDSARISLFFDSCNTLFLFPSRHCNQDIAVWKNFRKVRRSRCCSSRRSNPAIFAELVKFFMFVVLDLLDQRIDLVLANCTAETGTPDIM